MASAYMTSKLESIQIPEKRRFEHHLKPLVAIKILSSVVLRFISNLPTLKERCESQRLLGQGSQRQEAKGSEKSRLI